MSDTLKLEITIRIGSAPSIVAVEAALSGRGSGPIPVSDSVTSLKAEPVPLTEERAALARRASIGDPNTPDHPSAQYRHLYRSPDKRTAWIGDWAHRRAMAERGGIPPMPDYAAPTHDAYREKIKIIKELVERGDVETLKAISIVERSSTPASLAKYRDLAIHALTIRGESKRSLD
jgi:hypothetical protein